MQTILGANGTIGSLLAKELASYTDKIRLVSRNPRRVHETDELMPADLSDPASVDKAIAGSDIVYVVVGFEYKTSVWEKTWPPFMKAVVDACIRHHAKLVFFDNVYAYDVSSISDMTESGPLNPPSRKGKVRKRILDIIEAAVQQHHLKALIARAADFYGPHNEKSVLVEMGFKNINKGKKAMWLVNAEKIHSFTYTPDAAKATAILGNTPEAYGQVWHLPTSTEKISVKSLIELYGHEVNKVAAVNAIPLWLIRVLGIFIPVMREMPEMIYQYDRDYFFDSSKFIERFSFTPTSYTEGIRACVAEA